MVIPIFTAQLEKAKEGTDLANIRATYAEAMSEALSDTNNSARKESVAMTQGTAGWDYLTDSTIGDYSTSSSATKKIPSVEKGDKVVVTVTNGVASFEKE